MPIQLDQQEEEPYHLASLQALEVDLDPLFLAERKAVPIELTDGTLTVGMVNPDDSATIEALRFATRWNIQPQPMIEAEVVARLATLPVGGRTSARRLAGGDTAPRSAGTSSLGQRLARWARAGSGSDAQLCGLARLLDAGYSSRDAAAVLLVADDAGADESDKAAAERLRQGQELAQAIEVPSVPPWLPAALLAAPAAARPLALVDLVAANRALARRKGDARLLTLELISWAAPSLAGWLLLSWAGFAVIVAGLAYLASAVRSLTSERPDQDLIRAGVLEVVAILCDHQAPEPAAIRSGLARLYAAVPTWGRVPDDRLGLAKALSLDSVGAAALMGGSLTSAAHREAAECADRAAQATARVGRLIRCAGLLALGLALVLLLR